MTNQEFVDAVRKRLSSSDLPPEFVDDQCSKLLAKVNSLPEESAKKYTSELNVDVFADKIEKKYRESIKAEPESKSSSDGKESDTSDSKSEESKKVLVIEDDNTSDSQSDKTRTVEMPIPKSDEKDEDIKISKISSSASNVSDMIVIIDNKSDKKKKNNSLSLSFGDGISSENQYPNLLFAAILLLLAPVGLLAFATAFGAFLFIFLALAASIIVIIAAIIAIVAAGSLISAGSLLYGATQIISEPRFIGIHEIGFGLLVAGITILVSVILYNVALRLVPFIYAKLISFIAFSAKKVKSLFIKAKKGCENL